MSRKSRKCYTQKKIFQRGWWRLWWLFTLWSSYYYYKYILLLSSSPPNRPVIALYITLLLLPMSLRTTNAARLVLQRRHNGYERAFGERARSQHSIVLHYFIILLDCFVYRCAPRERCGCANANVGAWFISLRRAYLIFFRFSRRRHMQVKRLL